MSDQSGLVSLPNTLNVDSVRANVLLGLGKARLKTVLRITGAVTLDGLQDEVWADLTTAAFAATLPPTPADGDHYEFTKTDATANALTIGRNGKNINGAAADVTLSTQWGSKRLTYSSAAPAGWWSR